MLRQSSVRKRDVLPAHPADCIINMIHPDAWVHCAAKPDSDCPTTAAAAAAAASCRPADTEGTTSSRVQLQDVDGALGNR